MAPEAPKSYSHITFFHTGKSAPFLYSNFQSSLQTPLQVHWPNLGQSLQREMDLL